MVTKETINNIITKSILTVVKCSDYPKAVALRNFDQSSYVSEDYTGQNSNTLPSPVGKLQWVQEKLQEDVDYTWQEQGSVRSYSTDTFLPINMRLNGVKDWLERCRGIVYKIKGKTTVPILDENDHWASASIPEITADISKAIDKSPRVQQDTIVYRYGELPEGISVGDHGTFKGFQSTSFNPFVAQDVKDGGQWINGNDKQKRYMMNIYVPAGSKGIVLNENLKCMNWQSELLLDKGQRYIVLGMNDADKTADILLY